MQFEVWCRFKATRMVIPTDKHHSLCNSTYNQGVVDDLWGASEITNLHKFQHPMPEVSCPVTANPKGSYGWRIRTSNYSDPATPVTAVHNRCLFVFLSHFCKASAGSLPSHAAAHSAPQKNWGPHTVGDTTQHHNL